MVVTASSSSSSSATRTLATAHDEPTPHNHHHHQQQRQDQQPRRRRRQRHVRHQFSYRKAAFVTCWAMMGVCSYGLLGWTWVSLDDQTMTTMTTSSKVSSAPLLPPATSRRQSLVSMTDLLQSHGHVQQPQHQEQEQHQSPLIPSPVQDVAHSVVASTFKQTVLPPSSALHVSSSSSSVTAGVENLRRDRRRRRRRQQYHEQQYQQKKRYRLKSASRGIIWILILPICLLLIVTLHRLQFYDGDEIVGAVYSRLSLVTASFGSFPESLLLMLLLPTTTSSSTQRRSTPGRNTDSDVNVDENDDQTSMLLQSLALLNEDRRRRGEEPISLESLVAFQRVLSDRSLWVGLAERYRLYQHQEDQDISTMERGIGNINTSIPGSSYGMNIRRRQRLEEQRRQQITRNALDEKCQPWTFDGKCISNSNNSSSVNKYTDTTTHSVDVETPGHHHEECVICLATFGNGDALRTLPCQHSFHVECIDTWMGRSSQCPMCKQSILDR